MTITNVTVEVEKALSDLQSRIRDASEPFYGLPNTLETRGLLTAAAQGAIQGWLVALDPALRVHFDEHLFAVSKLSARVQDDGLGTLDVSFFLES